MRKGYIYYILDYTNGNIYIGSCWIENYKARISKHKNLNINDCSSKNIIKNNNYSFEILEENEFIDSEDKIKREQYYIDNNKCINKKKAFSNLSREEYNREYYKKNIDNIDKKERKKEWNKQYQKNKNSFVNRKVSCKLCKKEFIFRNFKKHYKNKHT